MDPQPLTPEARAVGTPEGTPAVLADGAAWTLAADVPLGGVWDDLYDQNVARGQYRPEDVLTAAYRLLRRNYRVTPAEAFELLRGVDPADLVGPVEDALFGSWTRNRTYSRWIEASLWAAGIDPETVPPELVRDVMDALVETGRAAPEGEFITVQAAMAKRHKLLNFDK